MNSLPSEITNKDLKASIFIKNAHANNLKGIDLIIPKNKLVVVTGVSGSGKSSLVMDTLYAEGQRRYVESLSSYARQFLSRMKKPDVEYIKGISPAIAIEQRVSSANARSTVGSMTELYDYLRLLYARIGRTISPVSGKLVIKHTVSDVVDAIFKLPENSKLTLLSPLPMYEGRTLRQALEIALQKGYTRVYTDDALTYIEELLDQENGNTDRLLSELQPNEFMLLVDRFSNKDTEENRYRISDSTQTAFLEGGGECCLLEATSKMLTGFNNRFEMDGIAFLEPSHSLFNYNNPYGACPTCEGYGKVLGLDQGKVIPDDSKSIYDGAITCWNGKQGGKWLDQLIYGADKEGISIHKPYHSLTDDERRKVWHGTSSFDGILSYFSALESKMYKIQNRIIVARFRGRTDCPDCEGARLRNEALYVKVGGKHIGQLTTLAISDLLSFFDNLELTEFEFNVAERLLTEINTRLRTMVEIGLGYLTLERPAQTLSGGETQRINLTRILGSNLTNSIYILDEPSIGLHPRDTLRLLHVLKKLRDLKNTVIVVEHEEEIIRAADTLIDIGPNAGSFGGQLVYAGTANKAPKSTKSLTIQYLRKEKSITRPYQLRKPVNFIQISDAYHHNLKHIDVKIPLGCLSVISGVSGSGKTSLVRHILYPALCKAIGADLLEAPGKHGQLTGDLDLISAVEFVNQSPIGRSSRSNPITYVKAYDAIRKLFTKQQAAKINGFKPKHFSFNVDGGRCDTCKGDGFTVVEMQFLSDVTLVCEECEGKRFKPEILDVKYKGKNIYDVLNMSIDGALVFFKDNKEIITRIKPLQDVGLGYIKLGQSSSTLSGGEAQRVKLASFLNQSSTKGKMFFIFDEPTTGLHFDDVNVLLTAMNALVEKGHTVLIVEHNLDVIKNADWLIDLGPEGGDKGGSLLYQGAPVGILDISDSYTARFLTKDDF